MADSLELSIQATPNPNAIKFTFNRVLTTQGKTYRDAASADVEWVKRLLGIPGITQVFVLNNFLSIMKQSEADWNDLGPQIERVLREGLP